MLRPIFSSRSSTGTLPSVDAMMIVFPEADGPNSLARSTVMVRMVPSIFISTFFMRWSPLCRIGDLVEGRLGSAGRQGRYRPRLARGNARIGAAMSQLGTDDRPLRIAIIGAGPTGFYTA